MCVHLFSKQIPLFLNRFSYYYKKNTFTRTCCSLTHHLANIYRLCRDRRRISQSIRLCSRVFVSFPVLHFNDGRIVLLKASQAPRGPTIQSSLPLPAKSVYHPSSSETCHLLILSDNHALRPIDLAKMCSLLKFPNFP